MQQQEATPGRRVVRTHKPERIVSFRLIGSA
jgi:hypothetical protein